MEIFKDSIFDSVLIRENTVFIRENTSQRKPYSLILSLYVKIWVRENRILWFYLYTWKYGSEKTVFFDSIFIRKNTGQRKPYSLILSLYVKIRVRQQRILACFTQRHTVKNRQVLWIFLLIIHWVKRVRIRSYSGPHFSRIYPHSDWIRRDS